MRISDWSSDVCSSDLACTAHEWLERPGTVGRSLAGAEIQIVDAEGNALPVGEVGEIICGHPTASDFTYQGDDGKRLSIDRAGLIATGDMGYLDEAGYLFICDRATDMIISGGVNIYPAEIADRKRTRLNSSH